MNDIVQKFSLALFPSRRYIAVGAVQAIIIIFKRCLMSETKNSQSDIVAEAVAAYGRTAPAFGLTSTKKTYKIAGIEAPDAVWEFAKKHDLFPYLEMGIQWVREFFPTARNITLGYGIDYEGVGLNCIEIEFDVSGGVEKVLEQYQQLNQERAKRLPLDIAEKITFMIGWV